MLKVLKTWFKFLTSSCAIELCFSESVPVLLVHFERSQTLNNWNVSAFIYYCLWLKCELLSGSVMSPEPTDCSGDVTDPFSNSHLWALPGRAWWRCQTQRQRCSRCRWGRWWTWEPWPPSLSWWGETRGEPDERSSMARWSCSTWEGGVPENYRFCRKVSIHHSLNTMHCAHDLKT